MQSESDEYLVAMDREDEANTIQEVNEDSHEDDYSGDEHSGMAFASRPPQHSNLLDIMDERQWPTFWNFCE